MTNPVRPPELVELERGLPVQCRRGHPFDMAREQMAQAIRIQDTLEKDPRDRLRAARTIARGAIDIISHGIPTK